MAAVGTDELKIAKLEKIASGGPLVFKKTQIKALLELGKIYTSQNKFKEAFECYERAVGLGSSLAQLMIAVLIQEGKVTGHTVQECFERSVKAAEQGLIEAECYVIELLLQGIGVPKNPIEAFKRCERAAQKGYGQALLLLAHMYGGGVGVEVNWGKAITCFQAAAKKGVANAHFFLACFYLPNGADTHADLRAVLDIDINKARWHYQQIDKAQLKPPLTPDMFPQFGLELQAIEKADEMSPRAGELLKKAKGGLFQSGDPIAQLELGSLYADEKNHHDFPKMSMAKRNIEAQKWVECSAEQGNIDAQLSLGVAYETGMLGLEKNARKMFYWYQRAAMQNDPNAEGRLAFLFFTGTMVPKNLQKALYWIEYAIEHADKREKRIRGGGRSPSSISVDKAGYCKLKDEILKAKLTKKEEEDKRAQEQLEEQKKAEELRRNQEEEARAMEFKRQLEAKATAERERFEAVSAEFVKLKKKEIEKAEHRPQAITKYLEMQPMSMMSGILNDNSVDVVDGEVVTFERSNAGP